MRFAYDTAADAGKLEGDLLHCRTCTNDIPEGVSPKKWARLSVCIAEGGRIQIYCTRHELNVAILSLIGPADRRYQGD